MIKVKGLDRFKKTHKYLTNQKKIEGVLHNLDHIGATGLNALIDATPYDSGKTAESWDYVTQTDEKRAVVAWTNDNTTPQGVPVPVLIQYGHATKDGGYVTGQDIINQTMQPFFDRMEEDVWREVTSV